MFEAIKSKMTARKAYALHVQGNQLIDRGEIAERTVDEARQQRFQPLMVFFLRRRRDRRPGAFDHLEVLRRIRD